MTEQPEHERSPEEPGSGSDHTGHPMVDEVLASLEGLEERPVEEHAALFEAAHDKLRSALSGAGASSDAQSG